MPIVPQRVPSPRSRMRSLTLRLPAEADERLRERLRDTGVSRAEAVTLLLSFALELEAELADIEPELGCYAANRRVGLPRAVAQLAARALGIETVEVYAPLEAAGRS